MLKIKTTSNHKQQLNDRFKLLFGKSVKIGQRYSGYTVIGSKAETGEYTAALYERGRLLLSSPDRKIFVFLKGDISAYNQRVDTSGYLTTIALNKPVTAYNGLQELKNKYHYVPPKLLKMIIKARP